jgi:zinc transport system ATP-binding protein
MPPLIDISHLDFAYEQTLVLKHIDLSVEAGTVLGLIGPNGGGKTTLVRLLLGLQRPTRGRITIAGLSPAEAIRRGDVIGYLPQHPAVPPQFPINVRQFVRLGLAGKTGMLRPYARADLDFAQTLLERVGAMDYADQPIGTLSGGQLQRVFIARALVCRPKLLLLDEPTTGIDRAGQQHFLEFLQSIRREMNLTVIFVSHDLRAVSAICDRIACLNLTLHYHDVPEQLPPELVYRLFACDLQAFGVGVREEGAETMHRRHAPSLNPEA